MKAKNKTPIIFDIDRTIFDTSKFAKITAEAIIKTANIDPRDFDKAEMKYLKKLPNGMGFNPDEFTLTLSRNFKIPQEVLLQKFYNPNNFAGSLYPDTLNVLNKLSSSYPIGVYSEGHIPFQKAKVEKSGIRSFIKTGLFFVFDEKRSPSKLQQIPKNGIFVEDKYEVVNLLLEYGFNVIWINRNSEDKHTKTQTVASLTDLLKFL